MASQPAGKYASYYGAEVADSYATFRPEYPLELYDKLLQLADLPARSLAVDVATGSGQAARGLSQIFSRVIAIDYSEEQLTKALTLPNVEFRHAAAECTGLEDGVADLVAAATALHWCGLHNSGYWDIIVLLAFLSWAIAFFTTHDCF